jgi:hypothetical protein
MLADDLASSQKELEVAKDDLSSITGRFFLVTHKYEVVHDNYQHVSTRLSQSLSKLKAELDSHVGTKAPLAAAAAELIVARVDVVDAVMEVEEANNQLFGMTAEIIAAQDAIGILERLYRRHDVQQAIDNQSEADQSFYQQVNALPSGGGGGLKWKKLACQLFRVQLLPPFLMKLVVDNIRNNTYTRNSIARVMDMHHGFNRCGLDAMWIVEPVYLGDKRLLWSSSSIK